MWPTACQDVWVGVTVIFSGWGFECTFSLPASRKAWPLSILLSFSKVFFLHHVWDPEGILNILLTHGSPQSSTPCLCFLGGPFPCPPRAPAPWGDGRSQQSGSLLLNKNQLLLFAGVCIANGLCKTPRGWVGLHCTGSTCLGADARRVSTAAFSPGSPKLSSQQPPGVFHQILKVTTKFF